MKNLKKLSVKIKNKSGDNLNMDIRYPVNFKSTDEKLPLVIFCHGFKGFKDWGGFPYLMEKISSENFLTVSFNFSYNGTGNEENSQSEFSRLELFAQNTFSRELDDLGSVIDFLFDNNEDYNFDTTNVSLIGHSRGGGIAILKAAEDSRIRKLVVLASLSTFDRYSMALKDKWKEVGYFEVMNARTNQIMRMNYTILEDLEKNKDRLNIQAAISKINIPVLLLHGTQDITVDYSHAEDLYSRSSKEKTRLVLIDHTGHTFGAVHPFEGTTEAFEKVITLTLDFLNKDNS